MPMLEELCAMPPKRPRKEYVHYLDTTTCSEDQQVFVVSLQVLAAALRGDPVWADTDADRSPETFKPAKYKTAIRDVSTAQPIYRPWLVFEKGRTRLVDGRHRLYALLAEGYTHGQVVADPPSLDAVRTLVDDQDAMATA